MAKPIVHGNRFKNLLGQRFGRVIVIREEEPAVRGGRRRIMWLCQCDCGRSKIIEGSLLCTGATRSCGCVRREQALMNGGFAKKHGMAFSAEYRSWQSAKQRCLNLANQKYPDYGGRGIRICDRWRDSFKAFLEDMGERPDGRTLDRIDNDGNYEPGNCRWATTKQQGYNRRHPGQKHKKDADLLLFVLWVLLANRE